MNTTEKNLLNDVSLPIVPEDYIIDLKQDKDQLIFSLTTNGYLLKINNQGEILSKIKITNSRAKSLTLYNQYILVVGNKKIITYHKEELKLTRIFDFNNQWHDNFVVHKNQGRIIVHGKSLIKCINTDLEFSQVIEETSYPTSRSIIDNNKLYYTDRRWIYRLEFESSNNVEEIIELSSGEPSAIATDEDYIYAITSKGTGDISNMLIIDKKNRKVINEEPLNGNKVLELIVTENVIIAGIDNVIYYWSKDDLGNLKSPNTLRYHNFLSFTAILFNYKNNQLITSVKHEGLQFWNLSDY